MDTKEKKSSVSLLPKRKQMELSAAMERCVEMGITYTNVYNQYSLYKCKIDTDEKKSAIDFMFNTLIEKIELSFSLSPIISMLCDKIKKSEEAGEELWLNNREFHLMQELIKNTKIAGKEMHIKLSNFMKAFNDDGNVIADIDENAKKFATEYQKSGDYYIQLCKKYNVMPENVDSIVEARIEELKSKEKSNN